MGCEGSLLVDRPQPDVLRLRLNRAEQRNALDDGLVDALLGAIQEPDAPVVVLGSTSRDVFCAGIDRTLMPAQRARLSDRLYELYAEMIASPAVVIAALDGHVVGGGAQLALASDVRIVGPDTVIRLAGPGHGLAVGAWGLPSLVGRGRALELCLSMRPVDAEEALEIGLVDQLSEQPQESAAELASHIARLDSNAVTRCKMIVRCAGGAADALQLERRGNAGWNGSLESPTRNAA